MVVIIFISSAIVLTVRFSTTQPAIACSKLIETQEQSAEYVQS